MNSEYMRTDDTVLVVNSYGNISERKNIKNIKDILIRENRLEELENIVSKCERNICKINEKLKRDKKDFLFSTFFCVNSMILVLGISLYFSLTVNLPWIIPLSGSLSLLNILIDTSFILNQVKKIRFLNKINNSEIIGYKSKIDVAKKKKKLVEFELIELEKNKENDSKCDDYYIRLEDEKYLGNLYRKLDNSYNLSRNKYLDEKNKTKVLKRVKKC